LRVPVKIATKNCDKDLLLHVAGRMDGSPPAADKPVRFDDWLGHRETSESLRRMAAGRFSIENRKATPYIESPFLRHLH
jgi:hypothetical protein